MLGVGKADTVETRESVEAIVPDPVTAELPSTDQALVAIATQTTLSNPIASKQAIRTSLQASTWDGVFAAIFGNAVGGVLLGNFLVELDATPTQIGLLASIPMVANLLQPLGAWIGDRTNSRHWYCIWIYGPSRLLWLFLIAGIAFASWHPVEPQVLVIWTLAIVCLSNFLGALGSAAWLSWLAALVPRRLRGRYFGIRNSAASLTNLLSVPIMGLLVSAFPGGSIQGYGILLFLGLVAGLISLGFQSYMVDVNPQVQHASPADAVVDEAAQTDDQAVALPAKSQTPNPKPRPILPSWLKDTNYLFFLLYFSLWMFAVNLSAPFFNLYMLDNLAVDVRWVTIYNSVQAGANMLMLVFWGRLADRVGNRSILLAVGILVAVTPLFWLGTGANQWSVWLWLPLLHILAGITWAAIDLCNNNLQLGVAPVPQQATYFAVAAAVSGVSGALGTTAGGLLAEFANYGGIPTLFALSGGVRLVALLPLIFVHERRGQSLRQMMWTLFPRQLTGTQPAAAVTASEEKA